MGDYEPRWSDEEQTMVALMELNGHGVVPIIYREYTEIHLHLPHTGAPLLFRADTEHEAIRKAFSAWSERNAKN